MVRIFKKLRDSIFDFLRLLIIWATHRTEWFRKLSLRMQVTAVGLSGHVSDLDRSFAERKNLKSLNRFERWLLASVITAEKQRHWACFRQACLETLGEDMGPYTPD